MTEVFNASISIIRFMYPFLVAMPLTKISHVCRQLPSYGAAANPLNSLQTLTGCIVIPLPQFTSHQAQYELKIETA